MVRREAFEELAGLDGTLPPAWNEVAVSLRLRDAGLRNVCLPQVRLIHHESVTRGPDTTPDRIARNLLEVARLRRQWAIAQTSDPYYNPSLTLVREDVTIAP